MVVSMKPERARQERAASYAAILRERFQSGLLSELHGLPQWVVWLIVRAGSEPRIEVTTAKPLPHGWAHGVEGVHELARLGDDGVKVSLSLLRVEQAPEILRMAERDGGQVVEFYLHRPNLQDAFLALTGHALRDAP